MRPPTSLDRITTVIVVVLATIGLALVWSAGPAAANHVSCGDTITGDATLDSDLIDCPGDGIVIGADGITLDLGGHTIDGADPNQTNAGVLLLGRSGVTITNGSVYEFYTGLEVAGTGIVVRGVTVGCGQTRCDALEAFGMNLGGRNLLIIDNTIVNNDDPMSINNTKGIAIQGTDVRIEGNRFIDSDTGIEITSFGNVVRNNLMTDNGLGVSLVDNSPGNLVEANTIRGRNGILVANGSANTIRSNSIETTDTGIGVFGEDAQDNDIVDNVVRRSGTGISVSFRASRNFVARNRVLKSEVNGIQVTGIGDFPSQNQVIRNFVRLSGADGIAIDSQTRGTLVEQNTSSRNRDDGIDVDNADTTITRNRADRNGDLGIEAVEGVTDGGGNRARGNRNREQCTGVVCR